MISRRRAYCCQECRWCCLRTGGGAGASFYCEARSRLLDRAELGLRCCDKFESWRGPAEP